MLFKIKDLQGIKAGNISLAFRIWKNARVKKGTLLKTAIGQIEVLVVTEVMKKNITQADAINAGHLSLEELLSILPSKKEGTIYKIQVAYHSPDPRIALRASTNLTNEEYLHIKTKLEKFDQFSKQGKWTLQILTAIKENPKLRAKDLAQKTRKTKDWLKPNIRKLKNLGLTISHPEGYTLSPRGIIFLERLVNEK